MLKKSIGRSTNEDDVICSKCRSAYKGSVRDSHDTEGRDDDFVVVDSAACKNDMISPKNIHLNILSTQTSHKYCIVCKNKAFCHSVKCQDTSFDRQSHFYRF